MPRGLKGERRTPLAHRSGRRARTPSCALKIQRGPREHIFRNNLMPNCVTITEPASDRKEQKFSVGACSSGRRIDQGWNGLFVCCFSAAQGDHDLTCVDRFALDLLEEIREHRWRGFCFPSLRIREDHPSDYAKRN
jgi:hypothetical protein